MQTLASSYIDIPFFQSVAMGADVLDYLGGNSVLNAPVTANATSLSVTNLAGFTAGQAIYLLDGPNSEIVFASPTVPIPLSGAGSITLTTGVVNAHAINVSVSSAGTQGALAALMIAASAWAENYCQQGNPSDHSLFQKTRSDNYELGTTRTYLDPNYTLVIRPHFFPVTAVTAISLEQSPGLTVTLDPTGVELDSRQRLIMLPIIQHLGSIIGNPWVLNDAWLTREDQGWCRLTYTAGFAANALPFDLQQAVVWTTQEFMGYSQNPTGAAQFRHGDTWITQRLRGRDVESTADGVFLMQARILLQRYRAEYV